MAELLQSTYERPNATMKTYDYAFRFTKEDDGWVREMWCATHFARAYERYICQCLVRIDEEDSQDDVDFELGVDNQWHLFQVAEVMQPDRRRGDEYKNDLESNVGRAPPDMVGGAHPTKTLCLPPS